MIFQSRLKYVLCISLVAQIVKSLQAKQDSWIWSQVQEDPLEKGTATHPNVLAWRIPWMEEPGGLQSMGLQSRTRLSKWTELNWTELMHVSMPFSQIIPPSPSPTESKSLFYTSVSLLLSRPQGYGYHLSKFRIYVLVHCIGVCFFFLAYFTLYNQLQFHPPH